jgi:hypothetical protein
METGVEVGAAIFDNREAEIGISSLDQRRENDAAGGNAEQYQRINIVGTEDHGEVRSGECADAMLGNDDFAFFGSDRRGDRSEPLKEFLALSGRLNSPEENISRTNLRQSGTKANLDMGNPHSDDTRMIEYG